MCPTDWPFLPFRRGLLSPQAPFHRTHDYGLGLQASCVGNTAPRRSRTATLDKGQELLWMFCQCKVSILHSHVLKQLTTLNLQTGMSGHEK